MRGHDKRFMPYFSYARRTGAARDVNTIVNSLCLDAPVIVFCAAEAPLGLVFSREDRDLPIFTRLFPREFKILESDRIIQLFFHNVERRTF